MSQPSSPVPGMPGGDRSEDWSAPPGSYGPSSYAHPWEAPDGAPPKRNRNLTVALVVAAVVLLAAGGVALWLLFGRGGEVPVLPPPATVEPEGLGSDPLLDAHAVDCYEGSMAACDDLFIDAELGSRYESYGDTCAGRQPAGTDVFCAETFPGR